MPSQEIVEWILFGVDIGLTALWLKLYNDTNLNGAAVDYMEKAQEVDISNIENTSEKTYDCAMVRGVLKCPTGVNSTFGSTIGVLRETMTEAYGDQGRKKKYEPDYFYLNDIKSNMLIAIGKPEESPFLTDMPANTYFDRDSKIPKEVFTKEYMLPVGAPLLGVGQLHYNGITWLLKPAQDGSPYILTTKEASAFKTQLMRWRDIYGTAFAIFSLVGIGIIGLKCCRLLKKYFCCGNGTDNSSPNQGVPEGDSDDD